MLPTTLTGIRDSEHETNHVVSSQPGKLSRFLQAFHLSPDNLLQKPSRAIDRNVQEWYPTDER